jgi:hypothetical protein
VKTCREQLIRALLLLDRRQDAIDSYVPASREKREAAVADEQWLMELFPDAEHVGGQSALDGIVYLPSGKVLHIECKTIFPTAANDKITTHPESRLRKEMVTEETRRAEGHTFAFDRRTSPPTVYHKAGFGAFRLSAMNRIGPQDAATVRSYLKEAFG